MKTIITTVLLITMLPIMCQQRQMSLDVTFDKEKKCLTFTFKNIVGICNRLLLNILQVISQKYGLNL